MPIGPSCGTSPAFLHFRERSGALNGPPRRAWASRPYPHQPTQGQGGATENGRLPGEEAQCLLHSAN